MFQHFSGADGAAIELAKDEQPAKPRLAQKLASERKAPALPANALAKRRIFCRRNQALLHRTFGIGSKAFVKAHHSVESNAPFLLKGSE